LSETGPNSEPAVVPPVLFREGRVVYVDQTRLPAEYREVSCRNLSDLEGAIVRLAIRGAPAIGIAAAYGLLQVTAAHLRGLCGDRDVLGPGDRRELEGPVPSGDAGRLFDGLEDARARLASTRPTAVNLFRALDRMARAWAGGGDLPTVVADLKREAASIFLEDLESCRAIGRHGAALLEREAGVMTHCNAGGLATSGWGTALGVIFQAAAEGKAPRVFVDETRPLLQGSRLTAWELVRRGIAVTLLCEGAVGSLLAGGRIRSAVVGADRIARNGDTANKVGTYGLAVLCREHGLPFYVAAPTSTLDPSARTGRDIPIEERSPEEVSALGWSASAPEGLACYNPAFDVTPAGLITAIVTERGVHRPPYEASLPFEEAENRGRPERAS
jgi:methylthioribose-1-phosphate isomerase